MDNTSPNNRDNKGRFVKGCGGNPNGRPKVAPEVREMLKAAVPDAARLLIECMNDPEQRMDMRVKCAETIMDRVYGKATQPIDGKMDAEVLIRMGSGIKELAE